MSKNSNSAEYLRNELKSLADSLEELLNSAITERSKEELSKIRNKAERALKESRYYINIASDALSERTRKATTCADEYVHDNPWTGVGIGVAIGLVLGVLLTHR